MMKRFKLGLAGLLLGLFGFTCFSSSGSYQVVSETYDVGCNDCSVTSASHNADLVCLLNLTCGTYQFGRNFDHGPEAGVISPYPYSQLAQGLGICSRDVIYYSVSQSSCEYMVNYLTIDDYDLTIIQDGHTYTYTVNTGVNLNLSSDIDFDTSDYPDISLTSNLTGGSCTGGRSELKINDVVHESAPFINITIPYEYSWDYTVDENEFDLVISGQNVDYEYIDGIIRTQQSKPNNTDFNNIVSGLIPLLIPGLVIILFLRFIFKFIKKIL